jgi:histidine triad (HIT) family protein
MKSAESINSAPNCIFCKIVKGDIPSERLAEDDQLIAIRDVNPQAPVHILVIPKIHIPNLGLVNDPSLAGSLFARATSLASETGIKNGYRIVVNTGHDGGQTVDHLHIHLLAGRALGWPPG